jgi:hypothetical protein
MLYEALQGVHLLILFETTRLKTLKESVDRQSLLRFPLRIYSVFEQIS